MEEIIKITEKNGQRAVNARELHAFLDSKQEFANWIKERIEKYGFIENQDFEVFNNFVKNTQDRRPSIEYALSIDMAYIWKFIIVMFTTKISMWVKFCAKLVSWSRSNVFTSEVTCIEDIPFLNKQEKDFFESRRNALNV